MSDAQNITHKEASREMKLHIKLTNKGMLVYGGWSNERLLSLLKGKLMQYNNIKSLSVCTNVQCDESLHFIIHSGMYNECILLELEGKGIKTFSYENFCTYILLFIVLLY